MARTYVDLIVNEPDGKARLNFRDRGGNLLLADVTAELASPVLRAGDSWGAREANELCRMGENGEPYAVTPEYTAAEKPAALVPGEAMAEAFAKLAAAVNALGNKAEKQGTSPALTSGDALQLGGHAPRWWMPAGLVAPFAGVQIPQGWLLCDGRAVSRTQYKELYAVIGTAYGGGDGSSTFNLPDLRTRTAVGCDAKHPLTGKAGSESVIFTYDNLPAGLPAAGWQTQFKAALAPQDAPALYGVNNPLTGLGKPLCVMQPSLFLNYIIKW